MFYQYLFPLYLLNPLSFDLDFFACVWVMSIAHWGLTRSKVYARNVCKYLLWHPMSIN